MVSEQWRRSATERWVKAVDDLRAARARFADAKVPMDLVRPRPMEWNNPQEPPAWTAEQREAVRTYAHCWMWLDQVAEEVERLRAEEAATRPESTG